MTECLQLQLVTLIRVELDTMYSVACVMSMIRLSSVKKAQCSVHRV